MDYNTFFQIQHFVSNIRLVAQYAIHEYENINDISFNSIITKRTSVYKTSLKPNFCSKYRTCYAMYDLLLNEINMKYMLIVDTAACFETASACKTIETWPTKRVEHRKIVS